MTIELRPSTTVDQPFLRSLYAESRAAELAAAGWSPEQVAVFCLQQFEAQDADYRRRHPDGRFDIVLLDGTPVGRLIVDRSDSSIHVIDVLVAVDRRGAGVGGRLFADLAIESDATGVPITLYVEHLNPARQWYERLGYHEIDASDQLHVLYRREPRARAQPKTAS